MEIDISLYISPTIEPINQKISHIGYFIIVDPIIALKDCWIIGDLFVSEVYHELPAQNQENRSANTKQLYIYRNYNVKCFSAHPLTPPKANPIARLVNALVNAVNENRYLP